MQQLRVPHLNVIDPACTQPLSGCRLKGVRMRAERHAALGVFASDAASSVGGVIGEDANTRQPYAFGRAIIVRTHSTEKLGVQSNDDIEVLALAHVPDI